MRKHKQSLGEMISSVSFVLLGVYFFLVAFAYWDDNDKFKALMLWLAAILCGLGGFRFFIAFQISQWRSKR